MTSRQRNLDDGILEELPPGLAAALNMGGDRINTGNGNNKDEKDDDDDSYDEEQELASLVVASVKQKRRQHPSQNLVSTKPKTKATTTNGGAASPSSSLMRLLFGNRNSMRSMAMIALTFLVLYFILPKSMDSKKKSPLSSNNNKKNGPTWSLQYSCPAQVKPNPDIIPFNNLSPTLLKMIRNDDTKGSKWMKTFRNMEYDPWGHTYNQVKSAMTDWKRTRFSPCLLEQKSKATNSTTTKSAPLLMYDMTLGIGLDSIMTLEILQEKQDNLHVEVYGHDQYNVNDKDQTKTNDLAKTQAVLEKLLPGKCLAGPICAADSIRLSSSSVPENTFDVVFSSRINPLLNPLDYASSSSKNTDGTSDKNVDDIRRQYNALCSVSSASVSSWSSSLTSRQERRKELERYNSAQQAWYQQWVLEMIRLAKPGGAIIIEQIPMPLCQTNRFDIGRGGGVLPSFWNTTAAITQHVDVTSIQIAPYPLIRQRYHVFMKKKKA